MNTALRRWLKTTVLLLALAGLVLLGWRSYSARQAERQAQSAQLENPVIELGAIDVARVRTQLLHSGLPISGVLKAVISMRLIPRADNNGRVPATEVMITTPFIRDCIINKDKTKLPHKAVSYMFLLNVKRKKALRFQLKCAVL